MEIKKIKKNIYEISKKDRMNVGVKIFTNEKILEDMKKDNTLVQAKNISFLPGILESVIVLADAHQGYGFPIGGVAVFDSDKGIITPAGIGYDVNCGVRLLKTNLILNDLKSKEKIILENIFKKIPSGVGRGSKFQISKEELKKLLKNGAKYIIEKGYGEKEDIFYIEEKGCLKNANPDKISEKALKRGLGQLGTLGAGNHFLEIGCVDEIFDKKIAKVMGLKKNQITIMIHCGSRGLGHQVIEDYIVKMKKEYGTEHLPDNELVYAPIKSELGKDCLSAIFCAANYAFANRQLITSWTRDSLREIFPKIKIDLVYDVCHNIAKFENHLIKNKIKKVLIHRKGATRSFGKNYYDLPTKYQKIGQPVLIPGSMGTSSYVLIGKTKSEKLSFGSTVHGAGRRKSRTQSLKSFSFKDVQNQMNSGKIFFKSESNTRLIQESPLSYKDVDEVVNVVDELGISRKVARLKPLIVIK